MWLQRYAEPSVTTDEYEQGTYVYFDYNIMHDDMQVCLPALPKDLLSHRSTAGPAGVIADEFGLAVLLPEPCAKCPNKCLQVQLHVQWGLAGGECGA
jgi:hypothetical protein